METARPKKYIMDDLPGRPDQHVIDEQGIVLLQTILDPKHYIFRGMTGRDYGIDCMLEAVDRNMATGRMLSVQLKSSTQFPFFTDVYRDTNSIDEVISKIGIIQGSIAVSIKKTTCNYWLQNPMPVLLVLADVENNCLYYLDIKSQIRQRFCEFLELESFTFHVSQDSRLSKVIIEQIESRDGICNVYRHMMFKKNEILMFDYNKFSMGVEDFVTNRYTYYAHINHQNADPFLVPPITFYTTTVHIQELILLFSRFLDIKVDYIDFREVRKIYREAYEYYKIWDGEEVLEMEISELHNRIMMNIMKAISPLRELLINVEGDYWQTCNPRVYALAQTMTIEEFKDICGWARY